MIDLLPLPLKELNALVFNRLAVDPEGAAVRAVVKLHRAIQLTRGGTAFPFSTLRRGQVVRNGVQRIVPYVWTHYDDVAVGYDRLTDLLPLVTAAYGAKPLWLPAGAAISGVEVDAGGPEGADRAVPRSVTIQQTITLYM